MNPQPAKRPRIDDGDLGQHEGDGTHSVVAQQHPKFWFEDGNVILQAGSMQFKVHRSVLSSQSQIFKDMFSLPQPVRSSIADANTQSCPTVVLHDTPNEIENLISLLYDTLRVHSFREKATISVLETMLRLGRKYRFRYLRAEAIYCLESEFPATLADWDTRKPFTHIKEEGTTLFAALYLAHEHSIKSILPSISLLIGFKHTNNYIRQCLSLLDKKYMLKTNEPSAFFLGRDRLFSAISEIVLKFQDGIAKADCDDDDQTCIAVTNRLVATLLRSWNDSVFPFVFSGDFTANLKAELCPECNRVRAHDFDGVRRKLWDALPQYFGLDDVVWDPPSDSSDYTDEGNGEGE
ncbi:hypothetical protein GALMADRAFT_245620 [Galerina marginata CBS 339.88]|uniref:BTB domain-containing protein n=1 Tax=Galerina marginata (strain CBS 339.88) TaxID=685588 RepID=A0A067T542_GALM3|nr:hypothetical protein GALMADRAFT_245620 [Galerina marginata CBS 339.88]